MNSFSSTQSIASKSTISSLDDSRNREASSGCSALQVPSVPAVIVAGSSAFIGMYITSGIMPALLWCASVSLLFTMWFLTKRCLSRYNRNADNYNRIDYLNAQANGSVNQNEISKAIRPCLKPVQYELHPMVEFHKHTWKLISSAGRRSGMDFMFPPPTINYFDADARPGVRGHVALTIDDAPCRNRDVSKSMVAEVQQLLAQYDAKATFFVISDYVSGHEQSVLDLLRHGHELGNHGRADVPYHRYSEEDFEEILLEAETTLSDIREQSGECNLPIRWFRAPQARLSTAMTNVLHKHGFQNVFGDAYANDPWISDPDFIIQETLAAVQDGSIIIIHMPEEGFREHCYVALKGILAALKERGLKPVTLTAIDRLARQWHLRSNRIAARSQNIGKASRTCW